MTYKVYNEENELVASYSKKLDAIYGDGKALSFAKNNIHFYGGNIMESYDSGIEKKIAANKIKKKKKA